LAEDTDNDAGTGGIAEADVSELAAMVGQASDEQLAEWMADPEGRKRILDEIFRRMAEHVDPGAIKDLDAVIHFEITDAPGGGSDTYEAVFKGGAVTVNDEPTVAEPRVTIVAGPVPFLKLVTGQESGPAMFMTGKLRIKGDMMFASQMTSFFRIPSGS
jgi:putative sterol carrier protein